MYNRNFCTYYDGRFTINSYYYGDDSWSSYTCTGNSTYISCFECNSAFNTASSRSEICSEPYTSEIDVELSMEDQFTANVAQIEDVVTQCQTDLLDEVTVDGVVLDCETAIWVKDHILNLGNDLGYITGEDTMEDEEDVEPVDETEDTTVDEPVDETEVTTV
jgi:hypothetical protein